MQLIRAMVICVAGAAAILACSEQASMLSRRDASAEPPDPPQDEKSRDIPGENGVKPPPPPPKGCPLGLPAANSACFGAACEYGERNDPSCNYVARCDPAMGWQIDEPVHCPTTCPYRFDKRVPGEACSDPDICTYLEATCGCAGAIVAPENRPDGGDGDGGDGDGGDLGDAGGDAGRWQCVRPGNGCPARRPPLGTKCRQPMRCDYGTCVFGVPLTLECVQGTWQTPADAGAECP